MRQQIAKLTGRVPASTSPKYLAARLRDLERAKAFSVSMPVAAHNAVAAVAAEQGVSVSELVRAALIGYLADLGRIAESNVVAMSSFPEAREKAEHADRTQGWTKP